MVFLVSDIYSFNKVLFISAGSSVIFTVMCKWEYALTLDNIIKYTVHELKEIKQLRYIYHLNRLISIDIYAACIPESKDKLSNYSFI